MDLDFRVIKLSKDWAFLAETEYESVNVLGDAIRVAFVPVCILIACGAGRLNFLPTFVHLQSVLFRIQINRSRKTHDFIIHI